jgi:hypothetical protein
MNAQQKLELGNRVRVTNESPVKAEIGKVGTVQFNKGQSWYIALDGETRPKNIEGRETYLLSIYKKYLELI